MRKDSRFLNDAFLNRALKVLGVLILTFALLFVLTLFAPFWRAIAFAIRNVAVPVLLAWLLSIIMFPLIRYLERKGIGPRGLNVVFVYLAVLMLIYGFFRFLTPLVFEQIQMFFNEDYPRLVDYFQNQLRDDFIFGGAAYDYLAAAFDEAGIVGMTVESVVDTLASFVPSTLYGLVMVVAILPILLLFYLLDYERINQALGTLIPKRFVGPSRELISNLNMTVGAYIRGQLFLMITIGIVSAMVYRLLGIQYYLIFGLIVGLLNIVPYFGSLIAMIPIAIYVGITGDGNVGVLAIILVNIGLQFIEGSIFQPVIMGRQLKIHPLFIIISILFFGSLFGVLGVVFASPIAATLRALYLFYREQQRLKASQGSLADVGDGS